MKGLDQENENRSMMKTTYNDNRVDKSNELNDTMTLNEGSRDEYENTIHNLGGNQEWQTQQLWQVLKPWNSITMIIVSLGILVQIGVMFQQILKLLSISTYFLN